LGLGALWATAFARKLSAAPLLVESPPQPRDRMATA
jgi:hypothetical protein